MMIKVKYIPNFLHADDRKEINVPCEDTLQSLRGILDESGFPYEGMRILVDSRRIENIDLELVGAGSLVIITNDIRDPVTIATVASFAISAVQVSAWVSWTLFLITTAYAVYSALQKPKTPNFNADSEGMDDGSPTASWDGISTTQEVGLPIPVIFGEHRVGGNVINQFVTTDGDKSYLNILLGLCEGEIESISDIKINDNPSANFAGITSYTRFGTSNQTTIPNFLDLHNVISVGVTLTKDNPYVYTTIDSAVEAFELIMTLTNGLFQQDSGSGSILAWEVTVLVEYKLTSAGTWTTAGTMTINAKNRSSFRRIFRKDGLAAGKYDIRVTRTSDDSSLSPSKVGDLTFSSVDEIQTDDLAYPNVALLGIKALATDQLSGSTPNITCLVKGTKVSVPQVMDGVTEVDWDDYYWDPATSEYKLLSDDTALTWDGSTYVERYCANPIWCVKHLLLNNRYGLGDYIDVSHISQADFLAMSRICEQKVDDGNSGYEKLYRLDVVIDSHNKALDLLVQLAATFDAFVFYSEGAVKMVIDTDDDPVQYFGMGNIVENSLQMSWKSKKEVFNAIDVQFNDSEKDYRLETVSIIDQDSLNAGEPLRKKTLRIHTTRVSYALRAGRRALKVSKYIHRSFSFKAGIDAIAISPGDPIGFNHDVPQIGFSGIVRSGSTTSNVKLDQQVAIESGKTYKVIVQFADGTIAEREVTNSPGTTDTLTVTPTFSNAPAFFDKYAFGEENIHYKKMRVVSISIDEELNATINALEMNENVYDFSAVDLPATKISLLSAEIQDVTELSVTEMIVKAKDGSYINTIEVWFRKPEDVSYFPNKWRKAKIFISDDAGASWAPIGESDSGHFVIFDGILTGATYKIAVVSVSANGMQNAIADSPQESITILGKAAPPSNVSGFDVSQRGSYLHFSWDPIPDGDLARYEIRRGSDWATGVTIAEKVDVTEFDYPVGAIGEQTYMVKAIDTSGNESTTPVSDTLTVVPPPDGNFALQIDPWASNREYKLTNIDRAQMHLYDPSYTRDVFILKTGDTFEGDDISSIDLGGQTISASGTIEQTDAIDLGVIFEFNLITDILFQNVAGGSITVEVSTSEDGTTWSAFAEVDPQENYRARYVKFKFTLESDTTNQVFFYAGTIYVNVPTPKIFYFRDVAIAISGTVITLRDDFTQTPRVRGLTVTNGVLGVPHITAMDADTMTIKVWDPVGAAYIGTAEVSGEVVGQ